MIEYIILTNLLYDEEYARKVIPYLKEEYFTEIEQRAIFDEVRDSMEKYNGLPSKDHMRVTLSERNDLTEEQYVSAIKFIDDVEYDSSINKEWLANKTESFCQDRAVYNAVRKSILILDGKDKKLDKGGIPQLLSDALAISFDTNVGHDFIENAEDRYDFYHLKEDKLPFDLKYFNRITKDGLSRKSLSVALAGTGVGKTLFMTHCAANNLMDNRNVLYITLEMAEERIAERIDANLLDIRLDDLRILDKPSYERKMSRVKSQTKGKLIIKEYPTASANVNHFRFLLNELKMKRNFVPDIIYIDYLNICASSRLRLGSSVNTYTYIKAIAEELRGLAVEFNLPIMTATQTNRSGYSNSDVDLTDTSESFGLPATADFMFAIISTEELEQLNQLMVKQLKNRWGDINDPTRFVIGVERSKMKLYDVEESAQQNVQGGYSPTVTKPDEPVMDTSGWFDTSEFKNRFKEFK